MLTFLLVVHLLVTIALVGFILMQRSEGGGLTSGGSPTGLMSARGAADFLTRTTAILATIFVCLSIALAALATMQKTSTKVDTSLSHSTGAPASTPAAPAPAAPAPAAPADNSGVPLAH
jgi:preprotein translocase subunit SecG